MQPIENKENTETETRFQNAFASALETGKLDVYNPKCLLTYSEFKREILPFIQNNPVTALNLGGNNIGNKGYKELFEALPSTRIFTLTGIVVQMSEEVHGQLLENYHINALKEYLQTQAASLPTPFTTKGVKGIIYSYIGIISPATSKKTSRKRNDRLPLDSPTPKQIRRT